MKIHLYPEKGQWKEILARPVQEPQNLEHSVAQILGEIKERGDEAVREYSLRFDGVAPFPAWVQPTEFQDAATSLNEDLKDAIRLAAHNIRRFHELQKEPETIVETMPGVQCWRRSVAIEKVGLYIPGGTAPLFSTVLMLALPASIAGCKEIVLCTPPQKDGSVHPAILFSAQLAGVSKVFKIGGVQAIGAMAYGTQSIAKVYKIFGPGNQYVTAAKQWVSREAVAIDMPAGPSEVLVLADETAVPAFVAADLLSQAEHGADSQVVMVCYSELTVKAVMSAIQTQLESLPRKEIAAQALANSIVIVVEKPEEALALINDYAPEHLILSVAEPHKLVGQIINAGSVFLGHLTPESAGDYASGTNHTLPTNGYARVYSGVSLDSFVKKITFQEISSQGLQNIGPAVQAMAKAESLEAHARAISIRLQHINPS